MAFPAITDQSGVKVANKPVSDLMRETFTLFEQHSVSAQQFFATAIHATHNVTVTIVKGGTATGGAAAGSAVTVDTNKTMFTKTMQTKPDGAKELAESTIFEIQNAINSAHFAAADTDFSTRILPLRRYGTRMAVLESESTWMVSTILQEVGNNYVPSAWGNGQIAATMGHMTLGTFTPAFVVAPHSTAQEAQGTKYCLPTEEMYAYQKISDMKSTGKVEAALINAATVTKAGVMGKATKEVLQKIRRQLDGKFTFLTSGQPHLTRYYHVVVDLFAHLATQPTWTVAWGGAGAPAAADWEFSAAMKALVPDLAQGSALAHLINKQAELTP
jgi:hypothetical protein